MEDKHISAFVAIIGVLVSALISYYISRRNAQIEYEKLKKQFTQKLFEKRLEVYPPLYYLLSSFQKLIKTKKANQENFEIFFNQYQEWDSKYAIFMSPTTVVELYMLYSYARDEGWNEDEALTDLLPRMIKLEHALKTELGIFDTTEYHNPDEINQKINAVIRKRRDEDKQKKLEMKQTNTK